MKKKNVDSLPELIRSAQDNGVRLQACQMSMDLMGIQREELIDGIETVGVATLWRIRRFERDHFYLRVHHINISRPKWAAFFLRPPAGLIVAVGVVR